MKQDRKFDSGIEAHEKLTAQFLRELADKMDAYNIRYIELVPDHCGEDDISDSWLEVKAYKI